MLFQRTKESLTFVYHAKAQAAKTHDGEMQKVVQIQPKIEVAVVPKHIGHHLLIQ